MLTRLRKEKRPFSARAHVKNGSTDGVLASTRITLLSLQRATSRSFVTRAALLSKGQLITTLIATVETLKGEIELLKEEKANKTIVPASNLESKAESAAT